MDIAVDPRRMGVVKGREPCAVVRAAVGVFLALRLCFMGYRRARLRYLSKEISGNLKNGSYRSYGSNGSYELARRRCFISTKS